MPKQSMRGRIRAYRASGRMFGQTFHTGMCRPETERQRAFVCACREVDEWFHRRNQHADPRYARDCVREAIARLREFRKSASP